MDWGTVAAAVAGSGITSAVVTHWLSQRRDAGAFERAERVRLEGLRRDAYTELLAAGEDYARYLWRLGEGPFERAGNDMEGNDPGSPDPSYARLESAMQRVSLLTDDPQLADLVDRLPLFVGGGQIVEDEEIRVTLAAVEWLARRELGRPPMPATLDDLLADRIDYVTALTRVAGVLKPETVEAVLHRIQQADTLGTPTAPASEQPPAGG